MKRNKLRLGLITLVLLASLFVSTGVLAVSEEVENAVNNYFADLPSDNSMIGQEKFVEKVENGEDLFVLDIRQPDVYQEAHIEGAVNLPWGSGQIAENLDKLPADEPIYVYCYTAQTANQTVGLLNFAGFDAVNVKFGWNLGISEVEGYKDAVGTETNTLGEETEYDINSEVKSAVKEYLNGLEEVSGTMFKNYKISEDNLKTLIDGESDIVILSIRQRSDFAEGHIPNAINIPWGEGMQEYFGQLPQDKKIVVYCYTGQTAGQTVAGLRLLGYDAVSLNGGIGMPPNEPMGWTNQGYELVQ